MNNISFRSVENIASSASFSRRELRSWFFSLLNISAYIAFLGLLFVLILLYLSGEWIGWIVGLCLLKIGATLYYFAYRSFSKYKLERFVPFPVSLSHNMILSGEKANIYLSLSPDLADCLSHLELDKGDLGKNILRRLGKSQSMKFILNRLGIGDASFSKFEVTNIDEKIWRDALDIAFREKHHGIEPADLFLSMVMSDKTLAGHLDQFGAKPEDIENVSAWYDHIIEKQQEMSGFLNQKRLKFSGGIGKDWAYGYTLFLKRYAVDVTEAINRYGISEIIGFEKEISFLEESLTKSAGANAIVVGDPGIGKRTMVQKFAQKVAKGEVNETLKFRHLFEINIDHLLAGINDQGEASERLSRIFDEAISAGNVIIYIDNISSLLSSGDAGRIDASEILGRYLSMNHVNFIFTIDQKGYDSLIENNSVLSEKLAKVEISEPEQKDLVQILEKVAFEIEAREKCFITYEAIKEVVKSADKFILNLPNPEKSINLLDSVCSKAVVERKETVILPSDVSNFVSQRFKVPGLASDPAEKEKLLNLEAEMHKGVIGQDRAITAIADALRRSRSGVSESKKPIGSFLFMGPTGVGKTETAKVLSRLYFGDENRMLRFDMSEYQNKEDVYRLIGTNARGEEEVGTLTSAVLNNPFSLLLFDEIEKAHPDILNLMLQILDEGIMTSGLGQKVAFSNTIIIATSNAGANMVRELVQKGEKLENIEKSLLDTLQKNGTFRPEFLNRFTATIVFHPLDQIQIKEVAKMMIEKIKLNVKRNQSVDFTVDESALDKLVGLGFDPEMGARPMARAIADKIENFLAKKLLSGELQKGSSITIAESDIA